ncbi:MAG: hypothetical protein HYR85_19910 [Planctomycetes bacterium]|nr:hypothetical protein [Planctomycetota bacterium]MBI3844495.1 hypothetical protein [Planctomycetota bacterium]
MPTTQLRVKNDRGRPHIIWIEPWAEDYTLAPGDELRFDAEGPAETPWFELVESENQLSIFVNGGGAVIHSILVNDRPVPCGYNRGAT